MRILVIGGTGYVGHRILERFLEAGHEVAVVSRGNLAPSVLAKVEHLRLDRKDRATFEDAMHHEQFDVVIDNIVGDEDDVASAVRAFSGRIAHYIMTSSVTSYHDTTALAPLQEYETDLTFILKPGYERGSAPHPTLGFAYTIGKRNAEMAVNAIDVDDFGITILRPPIVVGPDDRTRRVWWFVQRIQDGGPIVIPYYRPKRIFQIVNADDLAAVFVAAAANPDAMGKTYNVSNPELFTAELWVIALAEALKCDPSWVRIPAEWLGAGPLPGYSMPIAGRPFGDVIADTFALRRDLGFEFSSAQTWVSTMVNGCAASPPVGDSEGYERRREEIEVAERYRELEQQMRAQFIG